MDNIELSQLDRRSDERVELKHEPLYLYWQDNAKEQQVSHALCIDVSKRGLQVELDHSIPIGAKVRATFSNPELECLHIESRVLRCHRKNFTTYNLFLMRN